MKLQKQLSVFLDNKPGVLARIASGLAKRKVNILAISVTDAVGYCILRLVVDKPAQAKPVLKREGLKVLEQTVVAGKVTNKIGSLGQLAGKIAQAGINIDFVYGSALPNQKESFLVFGTCSNPKAAKVLK